MDAPIQQNLFPLNSNYCDNPIIDDNQTEDDPPVPISLVLRVKPNRNPYCESSKNGSNRCIFADAAPAFSGCAQDEKRSCNSISCRPSKANSGHTSRDDDSPGSGGHTQNNWQFENGQVFTEYSTQEEIFYQSLDQFTEVVLDGYDLTIIAYGQSGTGKSHTLFGPHNALGLAHSENDFGLLQRFVRSLFQNAEKIEEGRKPHTIFTVSSMDVDDNDIRDLLADGNEGNMELIDRSDGGGGRRLEIIGVNEIECGSIDEVLINFENGRIIQNSASHSSTVICQKSHHIFSINVIQTFQAIGPFVEKIVKQSTVRFVELAPGAQKSIQSFDGYGSSDNSMVPPGFLGSGNNVKLGNLALGNVVSALGDPRRNVTHEVRQELYQYSLITRILQDAIGGSSLTLAVCCVSAIEKDVEESVNTINFAKLLSNISCRPLLRSKKIDTDKLDAEIAFIHRNEGNPELNGGYSTDEDLLQKDLRSVSANINLGHMPNLMSNSDQQRPSSLIPTNSLAECTLPLMETSLINLSDKVNPTPQNANDLFSPNHIFGNQNQHNTMNAAHFVDNTSIQPTLITNPSLMLQDAARASYHESLNKSMLELQGLNAQHHQFVVLRKQYLNSMHSLSAKNSQITIVNQYDLSIIDSQIKLLDAQMTILQSKIQQLRVLYEQSGAQSLNATLSQAVNSPLKVGALTSSPALPRDLISNTLNSAMSPGYMNNNYSLPTNATQLDNHLYPSLPAQPYAQQHCQHLNSNQLSSLGQNYHDLFTTNHLLPPQPHLNSTIQTPEYQVFEASQRTSPFMPITQRSTPQDVSPLSHKQSPVSVQMYLQSAPSQKQHEKGQQRISTFHSPLAVPDRSPMKLKVTDDVNLPLNLSGFPCQKDTPQDTTNNCDQDRTSKPGGLTHNNESTEKTSIDAMGPNRKYENKKDGSSNYSGINKNIADQMKLESIVEESEHELTPPRLSRLTDNSAAFTDSSLNKYNIEEQRCKSSSQSDISSSSVSTEEQVRVVTGCSSSEDDVGSSGESSFDDNNENNSFDSECSDISSKTPDILPIPTSEDGVVHKNEDQSPIKVEDFYQQFRLENFKLLEKSESLLQEVLSIPDVEEISKNLDPIEQEVLDYRQMDPEMDGNEGRKATIGENCPVKNRNFAQKNLHHRTSSVVSNRSLALNSTLHLDTVEQVMQYELKDHISLQSGEKVVTNEYNNVSSENRIHERIKQLVVKRDAEKASAVQISSDLMLVDTQLKELKGAIKVKGGLIRDLEKTDREIKVALGQFEKRKQQLQEESAETRRKLRKANDYLKEAEQKARFHSGSNSVLGRRRTENTMGDTSTLKGHITKYRSQLEDMSKKILQLDVSQQCLSEMSKVDHSGSMEHLSPVQRGRAERVKEERTMVKQMRDEYAILQGKLKKEHDRKKQLEKNAENDEIKIRLLEKELSEKEELLSQLSKSLRASQDLEELKQSLDTKEQTLDKALLEFQKQRSQFEKEKLSYKASDDNLANFHQTIVPKVPTYNDSAQNPNNMVSLQSPDEHNSVTNPSEKTLRSEINELRHQKSDLYEKLEFYESKKNEYKKNFKKHQGTSNYDCDAEKEERKFLEDLKNLMTEITITIELIDMTIDYKNEKLGGNAITYDETIKTDSLALQKLCTLDIGETRNLIYKIFNLHVGLRLQLECLDKERNYLQQFCEQQHHEKHELGYKLQEQSRSFRKNYDIQKRNHEQKIQLLLKSQSNSGVNGGAGLSNDVQTAFERKIQELKETLKKTSEEGQQYRRFFREHNSMGYDEKARSKHGGEMEDDLNDAYNTKRHKKRSRRASSSRRRKSSDAQTNSAEDGTGSAASDISALDPTVVKRFQRHVRSVENRIPNNSVTIKQKKHGKNKLIINQTSNRTFDVNNLTDDVD